MLLKRLFLLMLLTTLSLAAAASPGAFSLTDVQGRRHTLADYQGKWVLVNLWATWCPPCLEEMPELEAVSKARSDLVVLGLAMDGQDVRKVAQFAQKLHVTYPIIAADDGIVKLFRPRGYPTTILYDPSGKEAFVKEGPISRQEIEHTLQKLTAK